MQGLVLVLVLVGRLTHWPACSQLSVNRAPDGVATRIPWSSMVFVGPSHDASQFVLKCQGRTYTFLCPSSGACTKWIKNISQLAGCSASTQVCHKTTTMGN